jgi:hypothetical protein
MVRATATVWALEKDEFWVVLPNTTECTFTCGTEPPQTGQMKGQHRVRLGDKCGMSSMHLSLRPATQADGRKITFRQAVVNFTEWQAARPEGLNMTIYSAGVEEYGKILLPSLMICSDSTKSSEYGGM